MARSYRELPELLALIPRDAILSDRINACDFSIHYPCIKEQEKTKPTKQANKKPNNKNLKAKQKTPQKQTSKPFLPNN